MLHSLSLMKQTILVNRSSNHRSHDGEFVSAGPSHLISFVSDECVPNQRGGLTPQGSNQPTTVTSGPPMTLPSLLGDYPQPLYHDFMNGGFGGGYICEVTPSAITIDEVPPVDVDLPVFDDGEVVFPSVNLSFPFPVHRPAVPQFNVPSLPGRLTGPYQGESDRFGQQAPPDIDRSSKPISGLKPKDPTIVKLWKFYCENFKPNIPFIVACEQKFRRKVGSEKTAKASKDKRKGGIGQFACPIDKETFTRKQNLRRKPLLVLFTFFR